MSNANANDHTGTYNTDHARNMAGVMAEVERIGFEPCCVLSSNDIGEGVLSNGTAVGFRWLPGARWGVEGPVETWSVWTWTRNESGTIGLNGVRYDLVERDVAFAHAADRCRHAWSPVFGSSAG